MIKINPSFLSECTPSKCCGTSTTPPWDEYWKDLSIGRQAAWNVLGWYETEWDAGTNDASKQVTRCWKNLNATELDAVRSLCYNENLPYNKMKWNDGLKADYGINCGKQCNHFIIVSS